MNFIKATDELNKYVLYMFRNLPMPTLLLISQSSWPVLNTTADEDRLHLGWF